MGLIPIKEKHHCTTSTTQHQPQPSPTLSTTMAWKSFFSRRTPKGASDGSSPSSRPPSSADPGSQHHQVTRVSQTPPQAHPNSQRVAVGPFAPTRAQPEVNSEWENLSRHRTSAYRNDKAHPANSESRSADTAAASDDGKGKDKGTDKQVGQSGSTPSKKQNKAEEQAGADDEGRPKISIWERKAASVRGYDGHASTTRPRTPLSERLREP
jgi:hypothetical protein